MFYSITKRTIDLLAGTAGLVVFVLPIAVIALLIRRDSRGPVIYTQKRVGKGGKIFEMYKFRTMVQEAEKILQTDKNLLQKYLDGSYKIKNDPRVTRVGKWLRKTSLDELPQFLNILNGEMSLVGPRAYKPDELEEQARRYPRTKPRIAAVLSLKPGLTGPWQIEGRNNINFQDRLKGDAAYAHRRSLVEDIKIILSTPLAVVRGKGAY